MLDTNPGISCQNFNPYNIFNISSQRTDPYEAEVCPLLENVAKVTNTIESMFSHTALQVYDKSTQDNSLKDLIISAVLLVGAVGLYYVCSALERAEEKKMQ